MSEYLGYTFCSNNCDDNDMLKQRRMLYCRSNRLVRLFQGRQTGGVGGVSTPPEFWMGGVENL